MSKLVQFLMAGIIIVLALRLFKFEQQLGDRIVAGIKTGEPEQWVIAAGLTTALGMVGVLAAQAFRKIS